MEACDEEITKSFRRSKIRVIILVFINRQYFRQANLKVVCKELGICPGNALGALIGSKKRYKKEASLIGLGLMERLETDVEGNKIIQYRITEKGARIASMLENEPATDMILGIKEHASKHEIVKIV
jgi:predicted transcriptional regulator with HTH domain